MHIEIMPPRVLRWHKEILKIIAELQTHADVAISLAQVRSTIVIVIVIVVVVIIFIAVNITGARSRIG
jgi:hypothetical protein